MSRYGGYSQSDALSGTPAPLITHFEAARVRASNFCSHRNWEKFHLAPSLAMALAGNEIFYLSNLIIRLI